jgi:hypothetical protein
MNGVPLKAGQRTIIYVTVAGKMIFIEYIQLTKELVARHPALEFVISYS